MDTTTDKVYRYSYTGTLLGSWDLADGNGSPTGIAVADREVLVVDETDDVVYTYNF